MRSKKGHALSVGSPASCMAGETKWRRCCLTQKTSLSSLRGNMRSAECCCCCRTAFPGGPRRICVLLGEKGQFLRAPAILPPKKKEPSSATLFGGRPFSPTPLSGSRELGFSSGCRSPRSFSASGKLYDFREAAFLFCCVVT